MTKKEENKNNRVSEEEVAYETYVSTDAEPDLSIESFSEEQYQYLNKYGFIDILKHFKGRRFDVQSLIREERDES